MSLRPTLAAALLAAAAGCSTIDEHNRVEGWPELRVIEHYVSDDAMRERCSKYVSFGMLPEACSEFNFVRGECHIWYSADFRPQPYVMEHERRHCEGFDHPGGSSLREALARYNAGRRTAGPAVSGSGRAPRG